MQRPLAHQHLSRQIQQKQSNIKFNFSFIHSLFTVEDDMTRFSIFRYDNNVDEYSKILLNEFIDDRISLLEAYDDMPDDLNQGILSYLLQRNIGVDRMMLK